MTPKRILIIIAIISVLTCGIFLGILLYVTPVKTGHYISALTIDGDSLYFGAGYCMYRLETQTQQLHPITCTEDWTFRRPITDEERLYAATVRSPEDGRAIVALNSSTGEEIWRQTLKGYEGTGYDIMDKTSLYNDLIYVPYRNGVSALKKSSGEVLWESEANFMDGTFPFLIHNNLLWYPVALDISPQSNRLVALNSNTGQVQYTLNLPSEVKFNQLFYLDSDWIIGVDGTEPSRDIIAIKQSNFQEVTWRRELERYIHQVYRRDNLLILGSDIYVRALEIETGQVKWAYQISSHKDVKVLKNSGEIVVFMLREDPQKFKLYGFEVKQGQLAWVSPVTYGEWLPYLSTNKVIYVANRDTETIDAIDNQTGKLLWQVKVNSRFEFYWNSDIPDPMKPMP